MKKIYKNHLIEKKLSQIFLCEENIIKSIINYIKPEKKENFIEIGPGLGALTYPLSFYINHLYVIEIDVNLANKLKNDKFLKKK